VTATTVGLLDTSTIIKLPRIVDPAAPPDMPLTSTTSLTTMPQHARKGWLR